MPGQSLLLKNSGHGASTLIELGERELDFGCCWIREKGEPFARVFFCTQLQELNQSAATDTLEVLGMGLV